MNKPKSKIFLQYFFGVLLVISALSFLIYQITTEIIWENISSKPAITENLQLKEEKDHDLQIVLDIFDNVEKGKISEALNLCYKAGKEDSLPPKIIEYFANFYEFYSVTQDSQNFDNCEVTTDTFIKDAHYLKDFFEGTKYQESWLSFAEIIPYYFIKNYDSKADNQKEKHELYKDYVYTLCEQYQFITTKGADVICLYIKSRYLNTRVRFVYELKNLAEEIEHFQETYPNQLGENGTLRSQRDYLETVKNYIVSQIDAPIRIKPAWNKDFPVYTF